MRLWLQGRVLFLLGAAGIFLLCFLVSTTTQGKHITNLFYDPIRSTGARDEVVIVAIDDKSLATYGAWPFSRTVFADLTTRLSEADAKVVAYDVLFLESREGDSSFKQALASSSARVILAEKITQGVRYSPQEFPASQALVNVNPDKDGKVRTTQNEVMFNDQCLKTLSYEAFFAFTRASPSRESCQSDYHSFRYPEKVATYSLADVLSGTIPREDLKNRVVFVGATTLDLLDTFVGIHGEKIPGVEVHAGMFVSLLNKVHDKEVGRNLGFLLMALYALFATIAFYRTKTIFKQTLFLCSYILSIAVLAVWLFEYGHILPTPWLILLVVALFAHTTWHHIKTERANSAYIQSLFSKYVHPDVLRELLASRKALTFTGEKREMTMLFTDIRGFTTISESLPAEQLTKLLNDFLQAMTPCILQERGTVDKFIGDAIMAFWNAPLYTEKHQTHALRAGLSMLEKLKMFNAAHGTELAIGVGIHSGTVTVGNIGSEDHVSYTVLGDAVNLASRLEGLTKKYGVPLLTTKETLDTVVEGQEYVFRKVDTVTVKGRSIPTELYEVSLYTEEKEQFFNLFEAAYSAYEEKAFEKAVRLLNPLAEQGDVPSRVLLERIPALISDKAWDGVWHWEEK